MSINANVMEHAGFKASLKEAERLKGDWVHGLPSGTTIPVVPIASLPHAPESWSREAGTYVCCVKPERGIWFDWTMNDKYNTAVIPSVKGMNPITGTQLDGLGLEQYADKCPRHDCDFSHNNYCPECGYEWPAQNYVSYPNTLWWDGFRQPDGKVRQFFFTEEENRDVASIVIGKENTVPAFGFAFYKPKNPRIVETRTINHEYVMYGSPMEYGSHTTINKISLSSCCRSVPCSALDGDSIGYFANSDYAEPERKSVAVGAGAEISQQLGNDDLGLDNWNEAPEAIIRLYFCFKPQFDSIVSKGTIELKNQKDGFMEGLPVG